LIVLVTLTIGLVIWIVAWSFGIKAFDAFMFTSLITVLAAGVRIAKPYIERQVKGTPVPGER
jgi:H+/gluconate symporter-like permease